MHLIYTPGCKFAQNFDAILIYDLFSIILFHTRWPCMHLIYTPACKFAQNFDAMLIYDFFLSFCFIYGDHACISSILQHVSLLQNCDALLIYDLFSVSYTVTMHACMPLIYTPDCKFAQNFWFMTFFYPFCSYGDHACISSTLQSVSMLETLMQCWFITCFLSSFFCTVTIHISRVYSRL